MEGCFFYLSFQVALVVSLLVLVTFFPAWFMTGLGVFAVLMALVVAPLFLLGSLVSLGFIKNWTKRKGRAFGVLFSLVAWALGWYIALQQPAVRYLFPRLIEKDLRIGADRLATGLNAHVKQYGDETQLLLPGGEVLRVYQSYQWTSFHFSGTVQNNHQALMKFVITKGPLLLNKEAQFKFWKAMARGYISFKEHGPMIHTITVGRPGMEMLTGTLEFGRWSIRVKNCYLVGD